MIGDSRGKYKPLTLTRYGITLRRITEADKEIIRIGRNKDFVRNNHVYRKIISSDEHDNWFREITSPLHYIFIIHYRDRDIGAVIVRDFLPDLSTTTCGAFIWDEEFLNSKAPILSILIALDFFFCEVGILLTHSIVLKTNSPAIKMNKFFGFKFVERDEESFGIILDRQTYLENRERLNMFAMRASKIKENWNLRIDGTKHQLNLPQINSLLSEQ